LQIEHSKRNNCSNSLIVRDLNAFILSSKKSIHVDGYMLEGDERFLIIENQDWWSIEISWVGNFFQIYWEVKPEANDIMVEFLLKRWYEEVWKELLDEETEIVGGIYMPYSIYEKQERERYERRLIERKIWYYKDKEDSINDFQLWLDSVDEYMGKF
jgi:hypothetical protein